MEKEKLVNYAKLIVKTGVNLKPNQDALIVGSVEIYEFIRVLVKELYEAGARKVFIDYTDDDISNFHYQYQKDDALKKVENFELAKQQYIVDNLPCRIYLDSEVPDENISFDIKKLGIYSKARKEAFKKYRDIYEYKIQWCIAGVPSKKWAKKLFPSLNDEEAVEKLWEEILKASRCFDGDPFKNRELHDKNLVKHADFLNKLNLTRLEYKSKNGTDFKVWLSKNVNWEAGGEYTQDTKIYFQPNIPTEEVFTSPIAGKCEGVVVATKPLSLNNTLVENFKVYFKDGKVDKIETKKGEEAFEELFKSDERSRMLGECALVPFSNPINNSGILFFSTLFDENACCHLALGDAFKNLIKGYETMSKEEIDSVGLNNSINHVDFMIGSKDLTIKGYDDENNEYLIFNNGEWAI